MSNVDKTLVGSNFCGIECSNRNNIIHPQTNVGQVLISQNNNNINIDTWLGTGAKGSFADYESMSGWLQDNYSGSSYTLPAATTSTLGGVIINDTYLTINDGILSIDIEALPQPTINQASFSNIGGIKLGNDTVFSSPFSNSEIEDAEEQFPLRLDSNGNAGIGIPTTYFNSVQANWTESDSSAASYIQNKPIIPAAQVNSDWNAQSGIAQILNKPSAATENNLGFIKIGYVKNGNNKAVQLDSNNAAYVDTEQHPVTGGMITNGLSSHFFRVGYSSAAGSYTDTTNKYIPIIILKSTNLGKCSVVFEILGREEGKTNYAKYYVNHRNTITNKLLCLAFYSEDTNILEFDDIICAKYPDEASPNEITLVVYKKLKYLADNMFIVNVLAENTVGYSTQHYFYTGGSSIQEEGYQLTSSDLRIGTLSDNSISAKLTNSQEAETVTMPFVSPINATYYETT